MDFAAYRLSQASPKIFLKIKGRPITTRPPVHFIAVLDTSGSMGADGRLTNCLDSLRFLTRFLTATDHLSLITFNGQADIPLKAAPLTAANSAHLEHILSHIYAAGGTNMSAAINCIQECIEAAPGITKTDVLFLTDGQANEGIVAIPALLQMVRTKLQNYPTIAVSTVGYSTDHNTDLLRSLAEQNAGSYNVVVDREGVASVFGVLLGGLMSCVGANLRLVVPADTICLPMNLQILTSSGTSGSGSSSSTICIGDVYADAETQILLSMTAVPSTLSITGYSVGTADDLTALVSVASASAEIETEAVIFELRQAVAALLRRCSAAAEPSSDLLTAIRMMRERLVGREDAVCTMLLRTLGEAEAVLLADNVNNQTRVLFAQNSAYTQMGRGLRATVSAASTVHDDPIGLNATRSAIDEDPFASPMMRLVAEASQALSIGANASAAAPTAAFVTPSPSIQRQQARNLTDEEVATLNVTLGPFNEPLIAEPPPLHRIQYATSLFQNASSSPLYSPQPSSPLIRQVAAPSRQTSNASNEPMRLGFQSPDMSPIFGSQAPINIPMFTLNLSGAGPKPA